MLVSKRRVSQEERKFSCVSPSLQKGRLGDRIQLAKVLLGEMPECLCEGAGGEEGARKGWESCEASLSFTKERGKKGQWDPLENLAVCREPP